MATNVGYNNDIFGLGVGCGGLITMVSSRVASRVTSTGIVMGNRAQWTVFQGFSGGDIGIVNVYALNESLQRCQLCESLIRELPPTCRWIFAGDFNMVEARCDKKNPCKIDTSTRT